MIHLILNRNLSTVLICDLVESNSNEQNDSNFPKIVYDEKSRIVFDYIFHYKTRRFDKNKIIFELRKFRNSVPIWLNKAIELMGPHPIGSYQLIISILLEQTNPAELTITLMLGRMELVILLAELSGQILGDNINKTKKILYEASKSWYHISEFQLFDRRIKEEVNISQNEFQECEFINSLLLLGLIKCKSPILDDFLQEKYILPYFILFHLSFEDIDYSLDYIEYKLDVESSKVLALKIHLAKFGKDLSEDKIIENITDIISLNVPICQKRKVWKLIARRHLISNWDRYVSRLEMRHRTLFQYMAID